jgi:hypothetical protein
MSTQKCTPAPPPPNNGPSDWTDAVQGNCFSNIERLGLWIGKTKLVPSRTDPSKNFATVSPGSFGAGANPPAIYVVTHGWAPGYRSAVTNQGGDILWWGSNASVDGVWASDWAWSPVSASLDSGQFPINATGMLQQIVTLDPKAVALAYSWIDDSATDSGILNLNEVYQSEAYTLVNGIRLANALEQAIAPAFWDAPTGLLHLIGHSHGSKVMTVAALTLQNRGRRVAHLTILDSPECDLTLTVNGANLLGYYLEQMQIANPSFDCAAGAFVDSNVSYFGVGYAGTANLNNVVDVALDPSKLYDIDDPSDQHAYAASWYGGAAAGAASQDEPPLGLAWPPPSKVYLPTLNQAWPTGTNQFSQWNLTPGPSSYDYYSYSTQPMTVTTLATQGVNGDPSTRLIFAPPGAGAFSFYQGCYDNPDDSDNYGIAFDMVWIGPRIGDYVVVTIESVSHLGQEVLLVMDGQSFPGGRTSVAINSDVGDILGFLPTFYIFYYAAFAPPAIPNVLVVSNFRYVVVTSASGNLRVQRQVAKAERAKKLALRAQRR